MAVIERVEIRMVDLQPKVKRSDAIQSFVSQETPFVRIWDSDGAVGTGYSYTIGTGGHAIVELLARSLCPALIGRDAAMVEQIWRDLLFRTHATTVGAITSLALAAIDTALWDLRCRKAGLPLHVMAGGAQDRVRLYTTEGGWLHIETAALVEDALAAKAQGFGGSKVKVGRPLHEDVRAAGGGARRGRRRLRDLHRRQPGASPSTRRSAARATTRRPTSAGSRSRCRPTISAAMSGWRSRPRSRSRSARASTATCIFANTCSAAPARSCRSTWRGSAASRPGSRPRIWPRPSMSRSARTS